MKNGWAKPKRDMVFNGCALWCALTWALTFGYMLVTEGNSISLWEGNVVILSIEFAIAVLITSWAILRLGKWHNV